MNQKVSEAFRLAEEKLEKICQEAQECANEATEEIFKLNREIGYMRGCLRNALVELEIIKALK